MAAFGNSKESLRILTIINCDSTLMKFFESDRTTRINTARAVAEKLGINLSSSDNQSLLEDNYALDFGLKLKFVPHSKGENDYCGFTLYNNNQITSLLENNKISKEQIWTVVDSDDAISLSQGRLLVNRLGYLVLTEKLNTTVVFTENYGDDLEE